MGLKARVVSKNWSRRSEGDRACRSRKSGSTYANNRGGEEVGLHAVVIAAAVVVVVVGVVGRVPGMSVWGVWFLAGREVKSKSEGPAWTGGSRENRSQSCRTRRSG